ncbi:MAG: hypothetical protein P1U78_04865 [Alcanivoracaceae bacterium]|nr:hypothetical protein [Alcanivoracaceae bacterium]
MVAYRQEEIGAFKDTLGGVPLCRLPFSVDSVEKKLDVDFEYIGNEGLGDSYICSVTIEDNLCLLQGFVSKDNDEYGVTVSMLSNSRDPQKMLNEVCDLFGLGLNELQWCREDLGPPAWHAYRVDEHGNEYVMDSFLEEKAAELYVSLLEDSPHKQKYYITRSN